MIEASTINGRQEKKGRHRQHVSTPLWNIFDWRTNINESTCKPNTRSTGIHTHLDVWSAYGPGYGLSHTQIIDVLNSMTLVRMASRDVPANEQNNVAKNHELTANEDYNSA